MCDWSKWRQRSWGFGQRVACYRQDMSGAARLFSRGQLHHLLTNPVYIGRIRHKDQSYPGQHPAIIDNALWQEVQTKLIAASARPRGSSDTAIEARISPRAARTPTEADRVPSRSDPTG